MAPPMVSHGGFEDQDVLFESDVEAETGGNIATLVDAAKLGGEGRKLGDESDEVPIPTGSLTEAKSLFARKDSDGKYQWVAEEPEDIVDASENKETARYAFLIRLKKSYDSRRKYEIDSIIVQSSWLKQSLRIIFEDYPGITTSLERLVFRAPLHPFVHRWTKLTNLLQQDDFEEPIARDHLQLFHDVLYDELQNAIAARGDLVKNQVITFEYLWTIFEPDALIFSVSEGKECVFKVKSSYKGTDQGRGLDFLALDVWACDWDGTRFGRNQTELKNYQFDGTTPITSLHAYPLDFHPEKEQLLQRLLLRGKCFERFAGYHYQAYRGVCLGYGRLGMVRHRIESRIIIDCEAHNRFLPEHAVYLYSLTATNPYSPPDSRAGSINDPDEGQDWFNGSRRLSFSPPDYSDRSETKPKHRPLTSEELVVAVPYVRGYAVKLKKWFWFFVDQVEPIQFADNAFASLVLPSEQKALIRAFVESQVTHKDDFDDVIAGKGRGMIMLLSGPPGVGKTLTSESVAEDMRVPLYMLSAGDLGLDPGSIEESLNTVLDMVSKWNAVLLLDEADVFLEARSTHDLERNKMVSIFLRVLEYYEGLLFLTTNRIKNIDEAFHSRIHVTINYPNLSAESRRKIWHEFLGSESAVTSKELDVLSQVDLNGRQIKNALKTAQMLSRSQESSRSGPHGRIEMRHIETILAIERGTRWG